MSMVCWNDADGKTEVLEKKKPFPSATVFITNHLACCRTWAGNVPPEPF
jgi:hypothetical protein